MNVTDGIPTAIPMNTEYIYRNRLRIRNDSTSFLSTPFTGSTVNDLHSDSKESASPSPIASDSPTASPHAPLEWEERGDSIRESNASLSHSPPNRGSRSSRIRRSPKWRRMGMSNPKKGTFAELHPDGPFAIYFTQQLEQRCSALLCLSLVQQKKPSLFKPILQNSSLLGVCLHCYTCCGNSPCVPYTPLSKSAHHAIMSSSEFSSSPDHVDITLILAGTYFLFPLFPIAPIASSSFATSLRAGRGVFSLPLSHAALWWPLSTSPTTDSTPLASWFPRWHYRRVSRSFSTP